MSDLREVALPEPGPSRSKTLRDYLNWETDLFLPLPETMVESLKNITATSYIFVTEFKLTKNDYLFSDETRMKLLGLLSDFEKRLKPRAGGEHEITKLSALAGDIMPYFSDLDYLRTRGKILFADKGESQFVRAFNDWSSILTQFRWIERTIAAYISQFEFEDHEPPPPPADVRQAMTKLLNLLPSL
ncbi:hypothetical protein FAI40_03950 [Acetobacteraceae bacterium]|nr:hypothetical protein FAI40_03950 [Acetobacteraceae bacterium]